MALKPSDVNVRLQSGTDRTLYATWTWKKSGTDKYDIVWKYDTGDGVWFVGNDGTSETKQSTYSAPSNAVRVAFKVRAVPKKGTKWKCGWSTTKKYELMAENLTDPGAPTVTLVGTKLTATIDGYEPTLAAGRSLAIQFELVKDDTTQVELSKLFNVTRGHAATYWTVPVGHRYKVRARGVAKKTITTKTKETIQIVGYNSKNKATVRKNVTFESGTETKIVTKYGEWSTYSENVSTGFEQVKRIISIETYSAYDQTGGVRVTWEGVPNFNKSVDSEDKYEVEYCDDEELFDSGETQTSGDHKLTHAEITGLELNKIWYFRVRAMQGNASSGAWSPVAFTAVGTKPAAPTTWSYTDTVTLGDDIVLNWAHSSDDGSKQTAAKISITIGEDSYVVEREGDISTLTIQTDTQEHWEEVFGNNIPYPTTDFKMYWKVSTKGIIPDYSDDSAERIINAYEPVYLSAQLYGVSEWLWDPFTFATDTVLTAQGLLSDPVDDFTGYPMRIALNATPDSQNAITYAVSIVANEGYDPIDATGTIRHVSVGDTVYTGYFPADPDNPNTLEITLFPSDIDLENNINYTLTATVAMDSGLTGETELSFDVLLDEDHYYLDDSEITVDLDTFSAAVKPICKDEFGNLVTDVFLSVYRREYDGKFVPIEVDMDGDLEATVTDPHPSLDYARYRVVAMSKDTGAITYDDIPGYEIGMDSIVIQWAEAWSNFDVDDSEELEQPPAQGSILVLPYNVDISESHSNDVSLVNYIGKESPVSYYGTQKGETGNWNCEIPKSDKETLYAVRRLAKWMGDVYVREPSGIGYWAQITVSYSMQHTKPTVPISFAVTRVDGGV